MKEVGDMIKKFKVILVVAAILVTGCGRGAAVSTDREPVIGTLEGNIARDFALTDLNGENISLSSYFGKKAILLDFTTTWCPYCITIMPKMKDLQKQYGNDGLEIISVYLNEEPDRVKDFISGFGGADYKVLTDTSGIMAYRYGIAGVPTVMLIDKDGVIRFRGHRLPEASIRELLGE